MHGHMNVKKVIIKNSFRKNFFYRCLVYFPVAFNGKLGNCILSNGIW